MEGELFWDGQLIRGDDSNRRTATHTVCPSCTRYCRYIKQIVPLHLLLMSYQCQGTCPLPAEAVIAS